MQLVHLCPVPTHDLRHGLCVLSKFRDDLAEHGIPLLVADGLKEGHVFLPRANELGERQSREGAEDDAMRPKGFDGRGDWRGIIMSIAIDGECEDCSPYILRTCSSSERSSHHLLPCVISTTGGNALRYTLAWRESWARRARWRLYASEWRRGSGGRVSGGGSRPAVTIYETASARLLSLGL